MPPLNAADLEDLDNLDPDDFDEGMDTAENRGDTIDPNAEKDDETDSTTDDGEASAESEENDATDTESGEDDEAEGGESGGDDEADTDDEAEVDDEADDEADDDEADDDEADDDEADEADDAKAEADDDSGPRIPKSRFDSVNARRKDAERKLAQLQAQIEHTGETGKRADRLTEIQEELGSLDDEINDAILDADAAKLKELRTRERKLSDEALQFRLQNATTQAAAEAKFDALIDKVESDYPEYNPDSENFNEEMVSETLRLQSALMASGSSKGDALLEAIDLIRPRYVDAATEQKTTLRDKPKRDTKTNTKRNKKVAKAQPAATASRSSSLESAEDIDYDNLTQPEDLDKFDEKTLARMSGDVLD